MKIKLLGELKTILSNPQSIHNYFAWGSIARLKNDKIAVASSGFRLRHVCPFGKTVIAFSEDEGETYTAPAPIIDTVLDDRDAGLCPFGNSGLILTSFNNTVQFQRRCSNNDPYVLSYLSKITPEQEAEALGATFKISYDNGTTWSKMYKSPITSPHGPVELQDGTILWIGRTFSSEDAFRPEEDEIRAYTINTSDGSMEYVSSIEPIYFEGTKILSCEPHVIQLADGTVICHIRVQSNLVHDKLFSIYQTESKDNGKTWTKPHQIIGDLEGAPSHMLIHSSGTVICTYSHRISPCGIHMIYSTDNCQTWSEPQFLYTDAIDSDIGYPATVELKDGNLLTIFYTHPDTNSPSIVFGQKWSLINE